MEEHINPNHTPSRDNIADIRPGIKTVKDAYQALAEAIVAQAFKDWISAQKLINKGLGYKGPSVPMSDHTRRTLYYGHDAMVWLLNTEEASFYAGYNANIVRLFEMVADQLRRDGIEIAKITYPFMRRD